LLEVATPSRSSSSSSSPYDHHHQCYQQQQFRSTSPTITTTSPLPRRRHCWRCDRHIIASSVVCCPAAHMPCACMQTYGHTPGRSTYARSSTRACRAASTDCVLPSPQAGHISLHPPHPPACHPAGFREYSRGVRVWEAKGRRGPGEAHRPLSVQAGRQAGRQAGCHRLHSPYGISAGFSH
jgi:hypothetical protein